MPELPDIAAYLTALDGKIAGRRLTDVRIANPFLLRSVDPKPDAAVGQAVTGFRRLGKRIAIGFEHDIWFVLHLMIAGRLHWKDAAGAAIPGGKRGMAAFDFENGTLLLTEAGSKKRASLHIVRGGGGLAAHLPPGLEVIDLPLGEFAAALTARNHTLKRALTDPRIFSGIGNAYSDEILHAAKLSPIAMTQKLSEGDIARLHTAVTETLNLWTGRFAAEVAETGWPVKVTAFRPEMAVHGKYGEPCPDCATPVQRIRYATNETNYCPRCQTGGKVLADRALSRLLKSDWPRNIDELEKAGLAGKK